LDVSLESLALELRKRLTSTLEDRLNQALAALGPLRRLDAAVCEAASGPELRALLIRLVEAGGMLERAGSAIEWLNQEQRDRLRKLGVRVGALDLFLPELLRPAALVAWRTLLAARGAALPTPVPGMPPVVASPDKTATPPGYRRLGKQALRLDLAEKLVRAAHDSRVAAKGKPFVIDPALAVSTGLTTLSFAQLLRLAGFTGAPGRILPTSTFGPPQPPKWRWQPSRRVVEARSAPITPPSPGNPFAALADLVR
jgi:ATP-dependent RNA helicase SUPV3L1/SUV3